MSDHEPFDEAEYKRRQKSRAIVTGLILSALALLFYFITIEKIRNGMM